VASPSGELRASQRVSLRLPLELGTVGDQTAGKMSDEITVDDIKTAKIDMRFPSTNQARACYTRCSCPLGVLAGINCTVHLPPQPSLRDLVVQYVALGVRSGRVLCEKCVRNEHCCIDCGAELAESV
jgi:hypothetical protein